MPNGKAGDNPLTDLIIHGSHPFPRDIEELLLRIDALGRGPGRWPLGENWPFSPREFDWEQGKDIEKARQLLAHLIELDLSPDDIAPHSRSACCLVLSCPAALQSTLRSLRLLQPVCLSRL
ncbi:MAG TPA: hypothetical protein VK583_07600 [Burkholderiales bacterium]|nr:hypothetical protein [Burkholderiales bacterium]